jgi:ABC-2 type transport system ATP-binding protein
MNRGRLIALDTPAALRAALRDPVLEVRTDDGLHAVEALAGARFVRAVGLFGRAVHATVSDEADVERQLTARLDARGVRHGRIERIEPTLEHVFIARVQSAGGAKED